MAGTVRGSIEHFITTTTEAGTRDIFVSIVRFFDAHPQMVRIASQAGAGFVGTASLALPGYSGDADRSGDNAFGVWRWTQVGGAVVYILVQWAYNSSLGTSPGNPAVGQESYGVAWQFALRIDGLSPWNGGTANAGADAKNGTNVWVPGPSTLLVWPRANGPGGAGATVRQYLSIVSAFPSSAGTRFHILSDNDALWAAIDVNGTGGYDNLHYFGPFMARSGVTLTANAAFAQFSLSSMETADIPGTTLLGTTTGISSKEGGASVIAADGVRSYKLASLAGLNDPLQSPNGYVSAWDIHDLFLRMEDATSPTRFGTFGKIDPLMLSMVPRFTTHDTNVGKTKACLGSTALATYKFLFPWDGVTTPGTGVSLTGVQF
jgi:hypothetical protein